MEERPPRERPGEETSDPFWRRLEIRPVEGGSRIRVRVRPAARRDAVGREIEGALSLDVRAQPRKGEANGAVCRALSRMLGLPPSSVRVILGQTAKRKLVEIQGLAPGEVRSRIAASRAHEAPSRRSSPAP